MVFLVAVFGFWLSTLRTVKGTGVPIARRANEISVTSWTELVSAMVDDITANFGSSITATSDAVSKSMTGLTINGNSHLGYSLSGGGSYRCFVFAASATVTINDMIVENCNSGSDFDAGAAFHVSGSAFVTLADSVVTSSNSGLYDGNFLYLTGSATFNLVGCSISSDIQKTGGTINVFSSCGEDSFATGVGTISCKDSYASTADDCPVTYAADLSSSSCSACADGDDPFSCCGATACVASAPACSAFEQSLCPDPTPTPTAGPTPSPSLVPTAPTPLPTSPPTAVCGAGTYLLVSDDDDHDDDGSSSSSSSSSGVCTACPIGRSSNSTRPPWVRECPLCAAGKYNTAQGLASCWDCPSGKLSSEDRSFCKDCQAGEYNYQNLECKRCEYGKYAPQALTGSCLTCGAGSHTNSVANATACTACDAGSSSGPDPTHTCPLCAAGQWAPSGQSECFPCAAGAYSATPGSAACTACAAGFATFADAASSSSSGSSAEGAVVCEGCTAGRFQGETGQATCEACVAGTFASSPLATYCVACSAGYWSAPASSTCTLCAAGYLDTDLDPGVAACVHCKGEFSGVDCSSSSSGSSSSTGQGAELSTLTLRAGYWRVGSDSAEVLACPGPSDAAKKVCVGGSDPSEYCRRGHEGPYCSLCGRRFFRWDRLCYACSSSGESTERGSRGAAVPLAVGCAVIASLCVIGVVLAVGVEDDDDEDEDEDEDGEDGSDPTKSASTRRRKKRVSRVRAWGKCSAAALGALLLLPHRTSVRVRVVAKTCFVTLQILVLMPVVLDLEFPQPFARLLGVLSVVTVNVGALTTGLECYLLSAATFYWHLVAVTLVPLAIAAALLLYGRYRPSRADRCFYWAVTLAFVMLPIASVACFRVFPCQEFDGGSRYLKADYSLDCDKPEHVAFQLLGGCMVAVWPLGVPLLFASLLWHHRVLLSNEADIDARNSNKRLDGFRLLFEGYHPAYFFWELVGTARRLFLIAVLVVVAPGGATQLAVALFACLTFITLQARYFPYQDAFENAFSLGCEWVVYLAFFLALLGRLEPSSFEGHKGFAVGATLTAFTLCVLLLSAVFVQFQVGKAVVVTVTLKVASAHHTSLPHQAMEKADGFTPSKFVTTLAAVGHNHVSRANVLVYYYCSMATAKRIRATGGIPVLADVYRNAHRRQERLRRSRLFGSSDHGIGDEDEEDDEEDEEEDEVGIVFSLRGPHDLRHDGGGALRGSGEERNDYSSSPLSPPHDGGGVPATELRKDAFELEVVHPSGVRQWRTKVGNNDKGGTSTVSALNSVESSRGSAVNPLPPSGEALVGTEGEAPPTSTNPSGGGAVGGRGGRGGEADVAGAGGRREVVLVCSLPRWLLRPYSPPTTAAASSLGNGGGRGGRGEGEGGLSSLWVLSGVHVRTLGGVVADTPAGDPNGNSLSDGSGGGSGSEAGRLARALSDQQQHQQQRDRSSTASTPPPPPPPPPPSATSSFTFSSSTASMASVTSSASSSSSSSSSSSAALHQQMWFAEVGEEDTNEVGEERGGAMGCVALAPALLLPASCIVRSFQLKSDRDLCAPPLHPSQLAPRAFPASSSSSFFSSRRFRSSSSSLSLSVASLTRPRLLASSASSASMSLSSSSSLLGPSLLRHSSSRLPVTTAENGKKKEKKKKKPALLSSASSSFASSFAFAHPSSTTSSSSGNQRESSGGRHAGGGAKNSQQQQQQHAVDALGASDEDDDEGSGDDGGIDQEQEPGRVRGAPLVVESAEEFVAAMENVREAWGATSSFPSSSSAIHSKNKNPVALVYHYTSPEVAPLILRGGFRMSTQGQGDGGVYVSTLGPCSYRLQKPGFEERVIADCFGVERLSEYKGRHKLDVCFVLAVDARLLQQAPGGRANAKMVSKAAFHALATPRALQRPPPPPSDSGAKQPLPPSFAGDIDAPLSSASSPFSISAASIKEAKDSAQRTTTTATSVWAGMKKEEEEEEEEEDAGPREAFFLSPSVIQACFLLDPAALAQDPASSSSSSAAGSTATTTNTASTSPSSSPLPTERSHVEAALASAGRDRWQGDERKQAEAVELQRRVRAEAARDRAVREGIREKEAEVAEWQAALTRLAAARREESYGSSVLGPAGGSGGGSDNNSNSGSQVNFSVPPPSQLLEGLKRDASGRSSQWRSRLQSRGSRRGLFSTSNSLGSMDSSIGAAGDNDDDDGIEDGDATVVAVGADADVMSTMGGGGGAKEKRDSAPPSSSSSSSRFGALTRGWGLGGSGGMNSGSGNSSSSGSGGAAKPRGSKNQGGKGRKSNEGGVEFSHLFKRSSSGLGLANPMAMASPLTDDPSLLSSSQLLDGLSSFGGNSGALCSGGGEGASSSLSCSCGSGCGSGGGGSRSSRTFTADTQPGYLLATSLQQRHRAAERERMQQQQHRPRARSKSPQPTSKAPGQQALSPSPSLAASTAASAASTSSASPSASPSALSSSGAELSLQEAAASPSLAPPAPGMWQKLQDGDGRDYFHNTATGTTHWEPPSEGLPL